MRWIWIDKFTELVPRERAVAVKSVSAAEEHLYDLHPDFPVHPGSLIVEGMAQTAGILVGHAGGYRQKVILAKIGRATFHRLAKPGDRLTFTATIDTLNDTGAGVTGHVTVEGTNGRGPMPLADIALMFSHIDNNLGGQRFPEHNFVFDETNFKALLSDLERETDLKLTP